MGLEKEIKLLDARKNGLHVITDEELSRMKEIYVSMLEDLDAFCREFGIEWALTGGSVIGAVRHKGFIPWDDDVDIVMTRKNFEKFKECFSRNPNPKYSLYCPGDRGYYCHIPKIFNNETELRLIQPSGKGTGLFIDIFVLDNTPDNRLLRYIHGLRSTFYLFVISCMVTNTQKKELMRYGSIKLQKQVKLRSGLSFFFRFRDAEWWIRRGTMCFSSNKNTNSKYVVSATGGGHYFHELYLRDEMCSFTLAEFEHHMFPIMKGYDYFLSLRYGKDYMTVPPAEKQEHHAVVALSLEGSHLNQKNETTGTR